MWRVPSSASRTACCRRARSWRYGRHGSLAIEIAGEKRGEWYDHENKVGGGALDLVRQHTGLSNGEAAEWLVSELGMSIEAKPHARAKRRIVATYDYRDEAGELLFQVVRFEPKDFRQRRPVHRSPHADAPAAGQHDLHRPGHRRGRDVSTGRQ